MQNDHTNTARKAHWEHVFETKQPDEVSWTQAVPETSLQFIRSFNLPATAAIIDIGGGDSKLVDFLLEDGFEDITVLDLSAHALERARKRLGAKAEKVTWIVSDITTFRPERQYDVWHDRAAFHFLTTAEQIGQYAGIAKQAVKGNLVIGTFSENGPKKCSGLDIKPYNEAGLKQVFADGFVGLYCSTEDHVTPFNTIQNFTFCSFKALH